MSQETNNSNSPSEPDASDLAKALKTISHVKGLRNIEYIQSNTFKLNFIDQPALYSCPGGSGDHLEDAPPSLPPPARQVYNTMPSAPPIHTTPYVVNGYPPEYHGYENHPRDRCTIL